MRRVDLPCTLRTATQNFTTRTDRALICDTMTELADRMARGCERSMWGSDWVGGMSAADAPRFLTEGDESRVAASDVFMAKLEDKFEFLTGRFRTVDAIAGGCPNVAAYLAGAPMAMRRRQRVADDLAPLTIVADCSSSSGISGKDMEKRGAAVLALVRLLSARRPVNLYAGVTAGNSGTGIVATMTRIETAPLDLARAAFMLSHQGAARGIGYGLCMNEFEPGALGWCFGSEALERSYSPTFWARVFPATEVLFISGAHLKDAAVSDPEKWLTDNLAKYGGMENQAAA